MAADASSTSAEGTPRDDVHFATLHARYARTKDVHLEASLLRQYEPLARGLAKRFVGRGEPFDDLFQVAMFGLLKALRSFDTAFGVKFTTYASPTVVGELKRHLRDHGWTVRAPRRLQELYLEAKGHVEDLTHELGRPPRVDEVAARCGVSEETLLDSMELGQARMATTLDTPSSDEGDDAGPRKELGVEDAGFRCVDSRLSLDTLLRKVSARDIDLLRMRFRESLTQQQIAERLGTNQMLVSRRLTRTISRLRVLAEANER